jgi:hypothetical protein
MGVTHLRLGLLLWVVVVVARIISEGLVEEAAVVLPELLLMLILVVLEPSGKVSLADSAPLLQTIPVVAAVVLAVSVGMHRRAVLAEMVVQVWFHQFRARLSVVQVEVGGAPLPVARVEPQQTAAVTGWVA